MGILPPLLELWWVEWYDVGDYIKREGSYVELLVILLIMFSGLLIWQLSLDKKEKQLIEELEKSISKNQYAKKKNFNEKL